nr:SDR family oxidoreductase [Coxiella burnetii]
MKTLHFISTTAVFDSATLSPENTTFEKYLSKKQAIPVGGYAQSKWVAEQLISLASKRGVPITIFRPGAVSSALDTPKHVSKDLLTQLLLVCQKLRLAPREKGLVDFVPADYASKAISLISQDVRAAGKVFHLTHPHPASIPELIAELNSLGAEIKDVPYEEWLKRVIEFSKKNKDENLLSLLPLMTEPIPHVGVSWLEMILNRSVFSCENTIKLLENKNIFPPSIAQLVMKYFF